MRFRELKTKSGKKVLMGKDAEQNEQLVKQFIGKKNIIMHTAKPGSPFCVIDDLKPTEKDISLSGSFCARYSQDWRDNKEDVKIHIFTGKGVKKKKGMKVGTFSVRKPKIKIVKKEDIEKCPN